MSAINSYPSYQGEDPNYDSQPNIPQIGEDICSTCLGRLENGIVHVTHRTNDVTQKINNFYHSFHEICIRPWIDLGHDDCPLCKESMERVVIIDSAKITEHRELSDKLTNIHQAKNAPRIEWIEPIELDELEPLVPQEIEQFDANARFQNLCNRCVTIIFVASLVLGFSIAYYCHTAISSNICWGFPE